MVRSASGKFVLRLSPLLHSEIRKQAEITGLSLNDFCRDALQTATRKFSFKGGLDNALIDALRSEYGEVLLGVLLFGSAARGDTTELSDIDWLIAVQGPIERSLYRRWDESQAIQSALGNFRKIVNPQFVALPSTIDQAGGIWLESAIEGTVLWEKDQCLHKTLCKIRRAIAQGEFTRSISHGHPYWIRKKSA